MTSHLRDRNVKHSAVSSAFLPSSSPLLSTLFSHFTPSQSGSSNSGFISSIAPNLPQQHRYLTNQHRQQLDFLIFYNQLHHHQHQHHHHHHHSTNRNSRHFNWHHHYNYHIYHRHQHFHSHSIAAAANAANPDQPPTNNNINRKITQYSNSSMDDEQPSIVIDPNQENKSIVSLNSSDPYTDSLQDQFSPQDQQQQLINHDLSVSITTPRKRKRSIKAWIKKRALPISILASSMLSVSALAISIAFRSPKFISNADFSSPNPTSTHHTNTSSTFSTSHYASSITKYFTLHNKKKTASSSAEITTQRKPNLAKTALAITVIASSSVLGLAGIILLVLIIIQDKLVYKPTTAWKGDPSVHGMNSFDNVAFYTHDGSHIAGWFIKQQNPNYPDADPNYYRSCPTMIYFHGRDKNASFRLKKVKGLYEKTNCNILLLSYRGFGKSTGTPSERGMVIDATSSLRYLMKRGDVDTKNLWVYGESLGGAVAVQFVDKFQKRIKGLILENTFTSLIDMIKLVNPILYPLKNLSKNKWLSSQRIPRIETPILFLSGQRDGFIPPVMMQTLFDLAEASKYREIIKFPEGTHNRTWITKTYFDYILEFYNSVNANMVGKKERTAA